MEQPETLNFSVIWRGKKFNIEMDPTATLKSLGDELLSLTNVRDDTIRLIVPTDKSSKLLYPFSEEHSFIKLEATSILEGKSIRMLGVPKDEVDDILQRAKADLRIVGFDEEEKRLRQRRISNGLQTSIKLPQGQYVFCDFRALHLPGLELNPPASKALRLMHKLAADRGIVAIMNKHRWRVGIMTEMAPEGYVGISPKCILGFNKNQGEEISLRLRTDDLKGFRKYDSIKKTLLHELAHMVHSEHDMNFHALDRQLNEEAAALDWTKSRSHTLNGSQHYEEDEDDIDNHIETSHKLGGQTPGLLDARVSSVVAAYSRLAQGATNRFEASEVHQRSNAGGSLEPDPDDYEAHSPMDHRPYTVPDSELLTSLEPDPDEDAMKHGPYTEPGSEHSNLEPDPDEDAMGIEKKERSGQNDYVSWEYNVSKEENGNDKDVTLGGVSSVVIDEPDPDDEELQRIRDPVTIICGRLQNAVGVLRSQAGHLEVCRVVQTILKIIRNVIEHPDEVKFRKLRKANPLIQRDVVSYAAAMEILSVIGFSENVIANDTGKMEPYLVLKRNDPGLLWLAKSSLETFIA